MSKDLIKVGEFGIAHGVSGRIKVKCFTEDPATVTKLGPVWDEHGQEYKLKQTGEWKDGIVVSIPGIRYRDQAEALRGLALFIPRDRLPTVADDEIYHVDLVGLDALVSGRNETAEIVAFHDFGAGDIMEVQPSWAKQTVMVPFNEDFVAEVDVEKGRVVIADVPGLFEEEKPDTEPKKKKRRRSKKAGLSSEENTQEEASVTESAPQDSSADAEVKVASDGA